MAFGEIAKFSRRVVAASDAADVKILAGRNASGKGAILVSAFKSEATPLRIHVKGAKVAAPEVLCVNSDLSLSSVKFESDYDGLVIDKAPGSAVFLIKGIR